MKKFGILFRVTKAVRDYPIRRKLILSFLFLIIFPIGLIGLLSFYRSSELLKHKTQQYTKDILMETGNNIETKLREAERLSFQIVSSADIQGALKNADRGFKDEYEKIAAEKVIDTQLKGFISSDRDIAAIQIMTHSNIVYYVNPGSILFTIEDADKKLLEDKAGGVAWFDTDPASQTIVVGRVVNSLISQEKVGYVFIYLRESSIFNIYQKTEMFKNSEFFIINLEGEIVSYKDKRNLGKNIGLPVIELLTDGTKEKFITSKINGRNSYVTYRAIEGTDWRIISFIPAVEYEKDIIWLQNWMVFICLSCCFLALMISFALSDSISRPVRNLSAMMKKVGEGDFNVSSSYESNDEMGILSSHFNKMVAQVQQLIQEVYQEQLLKQKAELKSLRMQINPHFLYNTLESINWIARMKGVPEVGKMVKALGDLMRASISGDDFVSIEEEMKNINNYLTIQKFRYGDRFDVEVSMAEEIAHLRIPKLILQPIVENAIVHGIENMVSNGKIEIKGFYEDGNVVIKVDDNGVGIEASIAATLLSGQESPLQSENHTRIGLRNVDRRIKMYYGQAYGVSIESCPGYGTNVTIHFPMDAYANGMEKS